MGTWPLYYKDLLILGNPKSSTGICTLWSEKADVLEHISKSNFHILGQGYSRGEGSNIIIRNCLANKTLHQLVLTGADLGGTGEALLNLASKGVDTKTREICGSDKTPIDPEIPLDAIERFRKNVKIIDKRGDYSNLNTFLKILPQNSPWGDPEIYDRAPPITPETFPSEETGFIARGPKLWNIWLDIVDNIMRFGKIKPSEYGEGQSQRELLNITSIITSESTNPEKMIIPKYLPFTKEDIIKYLPQVLTAEGVVGVSYTYGERYYKNFNGINQEDSIVKTLKDAWFSRRGVASLWDVKKDHLNEHPPCLSLIQAIQQEEDRLHAIYTIRSNDMFRGYGENILAFRCSQAKIAERLGIELGHTIMNSGSSHVYESCWNNARETLNKNPPKRGMIPDPRGNILITVEPEKGIKIIHLSPKGERIGEFHTQSAQEAYLKISRDKMISQKPHALYTGIELQKAETAFKLGLPYIQDKELDFSKFQR